MTALDGYIISSRYRLGDSIRWIYDFEQVPALQREIEMLQNSLSKEQENVWNIDDCLSNRQRNAMLWLLQLKTLTEDLADAREDAEVAMEEYEKVPQTHVDLNVTGR